MSAEIVKHSAKTGTLVWVALAFCIFAVVGAYSARMTNNYPSYDDGRADQRKATLAKVQHDENALLYPTDKDGKPTAAWVDQDKGLIKISIDEAMTHELADLQNVQLGIGAAIPGAVAPTPPPAPAPPSPPTPTANAAPAAAAKPQAAPAKPKAKKPKTPKPPPVTFDLGSMPATHDA
jgi:hypothetical protein